MNIDLEINRVFLKVTVDPKSNGKYLKDIACKLSKKNVLLMYKGEPVDDNQTLESQGVTPNSKVRTFDEEQSSYSQQYNSSYIRIEVDKKYYILQIDFTSTKMQLKEAIRQQLRIETEGIQFLRKGMPLLDDDSLSSLDIQQGDALNTCYDKEEKMEQSIVQNENVTILIDNRYIQLTISLDKDYRSLRQQLAGKQIDLDGLEILINNNPLQFKKSLKDQGITYGQQLISIRVELVQIMININGTKKSLRVNLARDVEYLKEYYFEQRQQDISKCYFSSNNKYLLPGVPIKDSITGEQIIDCQFENEVNQIQYTQQLNLYRNQIDQQISNQQQQSNQQIKQPIQLLAKPPPQVQQEQQQKPPLEQQQVIKPLLEQQQKPLQFQNQQYNNYQSFSQQDILQNINKQQDFQQNQMIEQQKQIDSIQKPYQYQQEQLIASQKQQFVATQQQQFSQGQQTGFNPKQFQQQFNPTFQQQLQGFQPQPQSFQPGLQPQGLQQQGLQQGFQFQGSQQPTIQQQGFPPQFQYPTQSLQGQQQQFQINRIQCVQGSNDASGKKDEKVIKEQKEQIEELQEQNLKHVKQLESSKKTIKELEAIIEELQLKISQLESELESLRNQQRSQGLQYQNKENALKRTIQQNSQEKEQYQEEIQSLNKRILELQSLKSNNSRQQNQEIQQNYLLEENKLKLQRQEDQHIKILKQKDQEIQKLESQLQQNQSSIINQQNQIEQDKRQIQDLQMKLQDKELLVSRQQNADLQKEKEINQLTTDLNILRREVRNLQINEDISRQNYQDQQIQINQYKQLLDQMTQQQSNINVAKQNDYLQKYRDLEQQREFEKQKKELEKFQKQQKQQEEDQKRMQKQQEIDKANQNKFKQQRLERAKLIKDRVKDSHGKLEICFLMDVTGSMDTFKENAMKCITGTINEIKTQTNRDVNWSSVAYQDFEEREANYGQYQEINFTQNSKLVESFLQRLECIGGGDGAEDVRNAIKQAVKLNWTKKFKIIILITDAPCHGRDWNGGMVDDHEDEILEDALDLLIQNNIMFLGMIFNKKTLHMFTKIRQYFESKDRLDLVLIVDLIDKFDEKALVTNFIKIISEASVELTQTANKNTKSKQKALNNGSGAMEALVKQIADPFKFDQYQGIKLKETKFMVYRVNLKEVQFEKNIQQIKNILVPQDFHVIEEAEWKCIRTEGPFAHGQMKAVYLMKKKGIDNELYVIKMPIGDKTYQSMNEALEECRSHLIAKLMMQKFMREINDNKDKIKQQIPQIQYSDFLILQDGIESFWIAERFFQGEFLKYNNNYGYICKNQTLVNHLAQVFSYYTYVKSEFSFIINDVQGVGNYFTDPAVNTSDGAFDSTDMGLDGISQFIISFDAFKQEVQELITILDINTEI